jgi:transposase
VRWLDKCPVAQLHVCLEATYRYSDAVAAFVHQQGHQVSLVNPTQIHAFAHRTLQRNKTNRSDALLIAQFYQLHQPHAWMVQRVGTLAGSLSLQCCWHFGWKP